MFDRPDDVQRLGRPVAWSLVGVAAATLMQACSSTPEGTHPTDTSTVTPARNPTVLLDFEGSPTGATAFRSKGRLSADATVKTVDGGRVTVEARPDGGHAVRFPDFDTSQRPQRAVLVMEPPNGATRLDPRDDAFEFGADFALNSVSEGASSDNGNNLVQRGLAADPTQFKIQIEHGRASCRVSGSTGQVVVKSRSDVVNGKWYAVTCARNADRITLALRPVEGGPQERVSEQGDTGALTFSPDTPLVVGGKVSVTGEVISKNSDQFNGAVDNVFLRIG